MIPTRRRVSASLALSLAAPFAVSSAHAQEWPIKPIRIIVPYPPGGNSDSAARVLSEIVSASLKQPVLVENRPGASTIIGTEMVARAPADGYTLGLITDSHAINQALAQTPRGAEILGARVPYDAIKDFTPVSGIALVPLVLVVNPKVPARTMKELVAYAQSHKDKGTNFGTMGTGSPWFVHMHQLNRLTNANFIDVPYKGLAPAATDIIGGQIDTMVMPIHYAQQHLKAGRLIPIAVLETRRHPLLPAVPTLAESGYPGLEIANWFGLVAPAGTPRAVVDRLSREFNTALRSQQVKDRFELTGDPYPATPDELAARIRQNIEAYGSVIQATVR
jgi:tripartite-type tricarboxylate transporter receptor subunit TctC